MSLIGWIYGSIVRLQKYRPEESALINQAVKSPLVKPLRASSLVNKLSSLHVHRKCGGVSDTDQSSDDGENRMK